MQRYALLPEWWCRRCFKRAWCRVKPHCPTCCRIDTVVRYSARGRYFLSSRRWIGRSAPGRSRGWMHWRNRD